MSPVSKMTGDFPPPNDGPRSRFIDFVQELRNRLSGEWQPKHWTLWGSIEPLSFGYSNGSRPPVFLQGLHAEFEFMDRDVLIVRLEFPAGFYSYVAFREVFRNSDEPYSRPFHFIPLEYIKTPSVLIESTQRELKALASLGEETVSRWPFIFNYFHSEQSS